MDRQDIDALLIGALYGELTPADEARLAAHLESHPADRSALDGLQVARDAVKQSRIFDVQADPPQAVSAILLQEAARRAPRTAPDPRAARGLVPAVRAQLRVAPGDGRGRDARRRGRRRRHALHAQRRSVRGEDREHAVGDGRAIRHHASRAAEWRGRQRERRRAGRRSGRGSGQRSGREGQQGRSGGCRLRVQRRARRGAAAAQADGGLRQAGAQGRRAGEANGQADREDRSGRERRRVRESSRSQPARRATSR